jgi:hypothetical protein
LVKFVIFVLKFLSINSGRNSFIKLIPGREVAGPVGVLPGRIREEVVRLRRPRGDILAVPEWSKMVEKLTKNFEKGRKMVKNG